MLRGLVHDKEERDCGNAALWKKTSRRKSTVIFGNQRIAARHGA
jgi:hypothetical protein